MFLLMFPLTFGSNTFVPADTMPGWLQAFVERQPAHAPGRRGARADARRPGRRADLLWTLAWMAGLLVVFVPLALRAYIRRA